VRRQSRILGSAYPSKSDNSLYTAAYFSSIACYFLRAAFNSAAADTRSKSTADSTATNSVSNSGAVTFAVTGGNSVPPPGADLTGTLRLEPGGGLVLADLYLGAPSGSTPPRACGHRFGG